MAFYSERIDPLIYRNRIYGGPPLANPPDVSSWPAEEIANLMFAIYDQRGASEEQSTAIRDTILETIPEEEEQEVTTWEP